MSDLGDLRSSLMKLESVIAERVIATQAARITELEEVLDKIETDSHIANGNLWRFWSRKAGEVADNNRALRERLTAAEAAGLQRAAEAAALLPTLRYSPGSTPSAELSQLGDCLRIVVNEGDLYNLMFAGIALEVTS